MNFIIINNLLRNLAIDRQQHKTALKELRKVASDRIKWRKVVDSIVKIL